MWTGHGTTHLTKEHIEPPPSTPATRCVHHSNRSKIGTTCTAARAAKRATSKPTRTSSPRADTFRTTASCTRRGVAASARTLRGRRRWRGGRCAATAGASATGSRAHWPGGTSISTALVGQRSPCRAPRGGTAVCSLKRGNGQKMRTYVTQSGGTSAVRDKRSEDAMWSTRANRKCGVVGTHTSFLPKSLGSPAQQANARHAGTSCVGTLPLHAEISAFESSRAGLQTTPAARGWANLKSRFSNYRMMIDEAFCRRRQPSSRASRDDERFGALCRRHGREMATSPTTGSNRIAFLPPRACQPEGAKWRRDSTEFP